LVRSVRLVQRVHSIQKHLVLHSVRLVRSVRLVQRVHSVQKHLVLRLVHSVRLAQRVHSVQKDLSLLHRLWVHFPRSLQLHQRDQKALETLLTLGRPEDRKPQWIRFPQCYPYYLCCQWPQLDPGFLNLLAPRLDLWHPCGPMTLDLPCRLWPQSHL
jgi:hypothetical protein